MSQGSPSAPVALSFEVFDDFEAAGVKPEEWDAVILGAGGDIYSTWDWSRTWWKHYGRHRRLRLFVFRDRERITCILPMFVERILLGPVWLCIAKLLGSDFTTVVCCPSLPVDRSGEVVKRTVEQLVQEDRCDAVHFGPLAGDHPAIDAIREAWQDGNKVGRLERDAVVSAHTVFHLPASFEAYLESLKRNVRANFRRRLRRLGSGREVSVDVVQEGEIVDSEFSNFVQMHAEQWKAAGMLGHFRDWPGCLPYHQDLVQEAAESGRLRLVRLLVDGQVVSYQLCFAFGDSYYWRLPARVVGEQWDQLSLGRIGLVQMIKVALGEGIRDIEAGPGHYDYKIAHGGEERALRSLVVVANRTGSRLRTSLFVRLARILDLCYYRGWFARVAPRLPLPRGPLWRCWIRSRL